MKLKTQLWIGDNEPNESLLSPIKERNRLMVKGEGGIWTSTFLGEKFGSDWVQWCLSESFNCPADEVFNGYLLEVNPQANIFTVDSLEDMHYIYDNYGYDFIPDAPIDMEAINFKKMSEDFDGMHLTEHGQAVTRHGFDFFARQQPNQTNDKKKTNRNLYGWDCESTHHFRWNFISVKPITIKAKSINEAG